METKNKTEQELKETLVTLGMKAGWHEIPFQEREMYGLQGLACFVDREPGLSDDWYGNDEFDLNFDCRYALIGEQYIPPGTGGEGEDCDEYLEPLISMYPVSFNADTGYYSTDCSETLTSLTFKEFVTMANVRLPAHG